MIKYQLLYYPDMVQFEEMDREYAKEKDLCKFYSKHGKDISTRFLLIRSLDKKYLEELLEEQGLLVNSKIDDKMKDLFNSNISIEELTQYILAQRESIEEERSIKERGLREIIKDYGTVQCGIRNDRIEDLVKGLVRDRNIKTVEQLDEKIDQEILPRIRGYVRWSFYNQASNDLIEHFFIRHPKVIPTLRRVPNVDFFININDELVPFDLKITHVADSFFDLLSAGLASLPSDSSDSFSPTLSTTEIQTIKDYYRKKKNLFDLPNFSDLSKKELLELLRSTNDKDATQFVSKCYEDRERSVKGLRFNLEALEWWNYKFQGERLFSNNNRFFVFLVYEDSFEDGRTIKGSLDVIEKSVNDFLEDVSDEKIHNINYYYDKERSLRGEYKARSASIIVTARMTP